MNDQKTILLLSKDENLVSDFQTRISIQGWRIRQSGSVANAITILEKEVVDVIFYDLDLGEKHEADPVMLLKSRSPYSELVILSRADHLEYAARTLENGASFYLIKPLDCLNISTVLSKLALRLERQNEYIRMEKQVLEDLMSGSPAMSKLLKLSMKIAPTSSTILLSGETGTGKEFFARIIHRLSKRLDGPFVPVNCGAIPDTLFESEMFGHKKGSFTGADRDKTGLAEVANLGTLFLDEVGELSPQAQVKLLRFLQERTVRRVGDNTDRKVNVRVIGATNKNLVSLVEEGKFREDLLYRLNVFHLELPPLRNRKETIPNLIRMFIQRNNLSLNKKINRISKQTEAVLARYDYPGNIRELENIIEHAAVLAPGDEIRAEDLPGFMFQNQPRLTAPEKSPGGLKTLADMEKEHIQDILVLKNNNYTEAAKTLGVSRSTLWRKLKEYGIEKV